MENTQINSYFDIEPVSSKHYSLLADYKCNPKSCNHHEHFNDYLRFCAVSDHTLGMGTTHVICKYINDKPTETIGYVTLKAATLITEVDEYNKSLMVGKPAIEISELAIKKGYERQGYGSDLLAYVVRMCKRLHDENVGIYYILVYADPKAVGFYKNKKRIEVPTYFSTLYYT